MILKSMYMHINICNHIFHILHILQFSISIMKAGKKKIAVIVQKKKERLFLMKYISISFYCYRGFIVYEYNYSKVNCYDAWQEESVDFATGLDVSWKLKIKWGGFWDEDASMRIEFCSKTYKNIKNFIENPSPNHNQS